MPRINKTETRRISARSFLRLNRNTPGFQHRSPDEAQRNPQAVSDKAPDCASLHPGCEP
jgi:hypothetical protein